MSAIWPIFYPVFSSVFSIFFVAAISGYLVKRNVITREHILGLTQLSVMVLLPCLMFSKTILYFNPTDFVYWWVLPLLALAMIGVGIVLSWLFFFKSYKQKKHYMAIASMMNANYMVLPIAQIMFGDQFNQFAAYCFLFIIGVNPILWSIGKYMVSGKIEGQSTLKSMATPPLLALLLAVILVLFNIQKYIPTLIMQPIDFIGQAAIPCVTIILGATLGTISLKKMPPVFDITVVVMVKLIILPALVIWAIYATGIMPKYRLIYDLLVIQAAVAPATTLIVIVNKYGGDQQQVGSMMLVNYILCLITIPVWLTYWQILANALL
jgi:malate permease and related proteins